MKPVSFRGFALNANGLAARFDRSLQRPTLTPISARREGNRPLIAAVEREAWQLPDLGMLIEGDAVDADALRRALLKAFDTTAGPGALIISDEDGTDERHIMAMCTMVTQKKGDSGDGFVATLVAADDVFWQPVLAFSTFTTMDASPKTISLTNSGDVDTWPTIGIYESDGIAGDAFWRYRRFVPIRWTAAGVKDYPYELTNGANLDTAALVTAGKLNAATQDYLGVVVDGRQVDRWYAATPTNPGGYNSTTTRIWANLDFAAGVSTAVVVYYYGGTEIFVQDVSGFPSSGILQIDNELFNYDGIDHYRQSFLNVSRSAYGSSPANHGYDAVVYWIQHETWIVYSSGYSWASSPISNSKKPLFNLETSRNTVWKWQVFGSLVDPERPGNWTALAGGTGQTFTGYRHAAETDPFQVMGIVRPGAGSTLSTNYSFWRFYSPTGIATIDWAGSVKTDFGFVHMNGSPDGVNWSPATQAYDAAVDGTWEDFSDILTGRPASWRYLQFVPRNAAGNDVEGQIDSIEITFQTALTPVSTMQPEQNNYQTNILFENLTTGESLRLTILPGVKQASDIVVINTETKSALILPSRVNVYQSLARDRLRDSLLRLVPGVNSIRITETPYANNMITFAYRARWYL